jgi:hypothetical protein
MSKEGERALQHNLFAGQTLEPKYPAPLKEPPATTVDGGFKEGGDFASSSDQSVITERQAPVPTFREAKAVSSLLRNKLLLEIVQRRIQKSETIILSFLLTQEDLRAQIGPYFVWVAESNNIEALKTLNDEAWQQLYFPEMEPESIIGD